LFAGSYDEASKRFLLHDGFENVDIAVLVDRNMDGVINQIDYPVVPSVSPPGDATMRLSPTAEDYPGGVRAGVVFYCAPPHATDGSQLILSWK
jgi:hypothetical protein